MPITFLFSGLQIITVDCRNHGMSPHIKEMDYYQMSHDILKLMDKLRIPKTNIIGHSMGGKVAMTLTLNHVSFISNLKQEDKE